MTVHHGWKVAAAFTSPAEEERRVREFAGLSDECWGVKIEIKSAKPFEPALSEPAEVWPLARGHVLVTCGPEDREPAVRAVRTFCAAHPCARWLDVSAVTATFILAGPRSREVLNRLVSLDVSDAGLPDGRAASTGLGAIHATLLRKDLGGLLAYRLLMGREYAEFVWDAVLHVGGIEPFGLNAFQLLERSAVTFTRAR